MSRPKGVEPVPLSQVIGPQTLSVFWSAGRARAAILQRGTHAIEQLSDGERLSEWHALASEQLDVLRSILLNAESYWTGNP
jgi:hypothetical protein